MSASKELKEAGVPGGVRQAAIMCNRHDDTIQNWYKNNYELFCVIKIGLSTIIKSEKSPKPV